MNISLRLKKNIIYISAIGALLSLFFEWVNFNDIVSINGFRQGGWLLIIFWIYPLFNYSNETKKVKKISFISSLLSSLGSVYFLIKNSQGSNDLYFTETGVGVYIMFVSSVFLILSNFAKEANINLKNESISSLSKTNYKDSIETIPNHLIKKLNLFKNFSVKLIHKNLSRKAIILISSIAISILVATYLFGYLAEKKLLENALDPFSKNAFEAAEKWNNSGRKDNELHGVPILKLIEYKYSRENRNLNYGVVQFASSVGLNNIKNALSKLCKTDIANFVDFRDNKTVFENQDLICLIEPEGNFYRIVIDKTGLISNSLNRSGQYINDYGRINLSQSAAAFKFDLSTGRNSSGVCDIQGIARAIGNNNYAFNESLSADSCRLSFNFNFTTLNIKSYNCNNYCGFSAYGTIDGNYEFKSK